MDRKWSLLARGISFVDPEQEMGPLGPSTGNPTQSHDPQYKEIGKSLPYSQRAITSIKSNRAGKAICLYLERWVGKGSMETVKTSRLC
jgi:hypothetical protein